MQLLSPHLSSCHPSIPSSCPPPLASPLPFLLHRGTKPDCNYCLQVFTHSHILMEANCCSLHNPKMGLNPQVKKKKYIKPCQYYPTPLTSVPTTYKYFKSQHLYYHYSLFVFLVFPQSYHLYHIPLYITYELGPLQVTMFKTT